MTIEPMTIGEIKTLNGELIDPRRLILTWAEAEARARKAEFWQSFYENELDGSDKLEDSHKQYLTDQDWLTEVMCEIGWPDVV